MCLLRRGAAHLTHALRAARAWLALLAQGCKVDSLRQAATARCAPCSGSCCAWSGLLTCKSSRRAGSDAGQRDPM